VTRRKNAFQEKPITETEAKQERTLIRPMVSGKVYSWLDQWGILKHKWYSRAGTI
jgi:hypothetical protein